MERKAILTTRNFLNCYKRFDFLFLLIYACFFLIDIFYFKKMYS